MVRHLCYPDPVTTLLVQAQTHPMKPKQQLLRKWLRFAVLACSWLGVAAALQAQGTGTIQGRVYNPATQQYVRNAEVRLEGTSQVTYTENDGSFTINNVPAGTAEI